MKKHFLTKIKQSFGVLFIVAILLTPVSHTFERQEAEAGGGIVFDPTNLVENALTAAWTEIMAAASNWIYIKECCLDPIAWTLAEIALQQLTQSTVEWINSGFNGSPSFVTDLDQFLLDIADRTAGQFIDELGYGFLCSPFELDIRYALNLQYGQNRNFDLESQCTLSDTVDNIDGFLAGDFLAGGWEGWFDMTTNPNNNPYGTLVLSQQEMTARITNKKGEEVNLLDFGEGFMSFKICDDEVNQTGCNIQTPGAVIENQLNEALDLGAEKLVVADEFNEVLNALFAQLVNQVLSGAGGLLGTTQSASGDGGDTYFDALAESDETYGYQNNNESPIATALSDENDFLAINQEVVDAIDDVEAYFEASCASSSLSFPRSLENDRSEAEDKRDISIPLIVELEDLNLQYLGATGSEEDAILSAFNDLYNSGQIHNAADVREVELNLSIRIEDDIEDFERDIRRRCEIEQNI